jgi:phage terminase large subunit
MSSYLIDFKGEHGLRYSVYEKNDDGSLGTRLTPPWSEKQIKFFDALEMNVLFGGARGPGKTEAIVWDAIFGAYLVPGSTQIIYRRIMGEMKSTIIERFKRLPPGLRGRYIGEMSYDRCELQNGSLIRFAAARSLEDTRKLLSGEVYRAFFDEWSEWPYSEWKFITGSVRTTKTHNVYGRPIIAQVKGASNPGGVGGDVLKRIFGCEMEKTYPIGEDPASYDPNDYLFIPALVDDNPAYAPDTAAGAAYRKMLMSQPRGRREAWLFGRWTGFEGQYFDNYEYQNMAIPHDDVMRHMHKQYWQPIWISLDWGKVHHSYVSWHTFIDLKLRDGTNKTFPVTFRELLIKGISEPALAQEIADQTPETEKKRVDKVYGSPDLGSDKLSRGHRMSDILVGNGLPRIWPAYNERENGWTLMYQLLGKRDEEENPILNDMEDGNKYCDWLIDDELEHAFNALAYLLVSKKPGHDGDVDSDGDSPMLDVGDGLRYGIASRISPEEKPRAQKLKEQIAALPVEGSSRYIAHLKSKVEERQTSAPFYSGSRKKYGPRRH